MASTTTSSNVTNAYTAPSSHSADFQASSPLEYKYIWLFTGPAGCGKSTIGKYLADIMKLPYIEGDDFHPKTNVEKMAHGIPLTDADRWDWLVSLREASLLHLATGHNGVVVSCSALKLKYRDVIRIAPFHSHQNVRVIFFYLDAPEDVLKARVQARKGHYMGANMVHSQFIILEPPGINEPDVYRINVSRPIKLIQEEISRKVHSIIHK